MSLPSPMYCREGYCSFIPPPPPSFPLLCTFTRLQWQYTEYSTCQCNKLGTSAVHMAWYTLTLLQRQYIQYKCSAINSALPLYIWHGITYSAAAAVQYVHVSAINSALPLYRWHGTLTLLQRQYIQYKCSAINSVF